MLLMLAMVIGTIGMAFAETETDLVEDTALIDETAEDTAEEPTEEAEEPTEEAILEEETEETSLINSIFARIFLRKSTMLQKMVELGKMDQAHADKVMASVQKRAGNPKGNAYGLFKDKVIDITDEVEVDDAEEDTTEDISKELKALQEKLNGKGLGRTKKK